MVWEGSRWFAKRTAAAWPELLAYRLGSKWLNVVDIVGLPEAPQAVQVAVPAGPPEFQDVVLVRLAQDHQPSELPINDLNEAIAAELVFSLWIRRRDAGPWNRAYLDGVPQFFDFHVAFDCEADNTTLDGFFRDGDGPGYPANWRVLELMAGNVPTTREERFRSPRDSSVAVHHVRDLRMFEQHVDNAADRILGFRREDILRQAILSGAPHAVHLAAFLWSTRSELPEALRRLRQVIYESVN